MLTLTGYFQKARRDKWAIGHFNFSTAEQLRAIIEVAAELKSPVMVGTSEGESEFFGYVQAAALVCAWRQSGYAVFLNADHHHRWESVKSALEAGYDTALIDASKLSLAENMALTRKVVDYARDLSKKQSKDLMVEGELGYLRGESQVQEKVEISSDDYTKPEEAREFVKLTGVDRLAIAFGNIHGLTTKQEMRLDWPRLEKIAVAVPETFLVLHGGSGLAEEDIRRSIALGITNVHISTELRVAYQRALKDELENDPQQTTPYKFLRSSIQAAKELVYRKIEIFGSAGKI